MTNYRPISLISNIAKIFEKITHIRIFNLIVRECNILFSIQYGFIVFNNLGNSKLILVMFLGKAFNIFDQDSWNIIGQAAL